MAAIDSAKVTRFAAISAFVVGALTALTEILKAATSVLNDHVPKLVEALDKLPGPIRWTAIGVVLGVCLLAWYRTRPRPSLLLQPEKFDLDPDNPRHLKGRQKAVEALCRCCREVRFVELTGESGSGKSAVVRSGLVPAFKTSDSQLYPLYLEFWGDDWVNGPLEGLRSALQESLTLEERKTLGLGDHPIPRDLDPLFQLLNKFETLLKRRPLMVFDQFDDYQRQHRSRFVSPNGFWVKPLTVAKKNPFWANVQDSLKVGVIHVLFVTRSDMEGGLQAVRFWEPASDFENSLQLTWVEGEYLPALLDELTSALPAPSAPPEQPVVENPEAGWEQLKRRLARDLASNGFTLPIQALVAVRSLASFPDRKLTTSNYEREGGIEGLEAKYVERSIEKCVKAQSQTGLTPARVLDVLVEMVDDTNPKVLKTRPVPVATLATALAVSENLTTRSLEYLRGRLEIGVAGGRVSSLPSWHECTEAVPE